MVSRRTDKLLHKLTHHTNVAQPYSENITGLIYPAQNQDMLGTIITLKYRNYYKSRIYHENQDSPEYNERDEIAHIEKYEGEIVFCDEFIVVRFDLTPPYKLIAISRDYKVVLVTSTQDYENRIVEYPIQIEEYIGLYMTDQFFKTPDVQIRSVLIRCDRGEPCLSVIAEFYPEKNSVRFVTDDEVQSVVMDRYDADGERDYNALDPTDHGLVYINLDGKLATNEGESITIDADAGYPDPLRDMYRKDILTLAEVIDLRKRLLIERRIYGDKDINVRDIYLDSQFINIKTGETYQLHYTILPEDATNQDVIWTSSDDNICTVDENGLVTPLHGGDVAITVTTVDGEYKDTCIFRITVAVTGVTIDNFPLSLNIGETYKLKATVYPDEATNKNIIWMSTDRNIITVNENGLIEAVSPGTAIISVLTLDGGFSDEKTIESIQPVYPVQGLSLKAIAHRYGDDDKTLAIPAKDVDFKDQILYRIFPENADNSKIYWTCEDDDGNNSDIFDFPSLPSESDKKYTNGKTIDRLPSLLGTDIYNKKYAVATTDDGNFKDKISVIVRNAIKGIRILDPGVITRKDTGTITAYADREDNNYDCTSINVEWESSDPSILKITEIPYEPDNGGYFKASYEALKYGEVTITVRTTDDDYYGTFEDTYTLDIEPGFIPVESIEIVSPTGDINLSTNNTLGYPGEIIVEAKVLPESSTYKKINARIVDNVVEDAVSVTYLGNNKFVLRANKYDKGAGSILVLSSDDSQYGGQLIELSKEINVTDYMDDFVIDSNSYKVEPFGQVIFGSISFIPEDVYMDITKFTVKSSDYSIVDTQNNPLIIDDKMKFTISGGVPGKAQIMIDGINKDNRTITKVTQIQTGDPVSNVIVNDSSIDWENVEIGDIVSVSINTEPSYYADTVGELSLVSTDESLLKVLDRTSRNTYNVQVVFKGGPVSLVAGARCPINNTWVYKSKEIEQVGTWHYATNITTDKVLLDYPENNVSIYGNDVNIFVDGDDGGLSYQIIGSNVPLSVQEIVTTNDPNYNHTLRVTQSSEIINHGTTKLLLTATDAEIPGSITKEITLHWGNGITAIDINEESSNIEIISEVGNNFPINNIYNIYVDFTLENSNYNATIPNVNFTSSDNNILNFNNCDNVSLGNGFETHYNAIKPGTVNITATSVDDNRTDTSEINIYGVYFDNDKKIINISDVDYDYTLSPDINYPEGSTINYSIDPESPSDILEVSSSGVVTTRKPGSANIIVTVTLPNGTIMSDSCKINVGEPLESISINDSSIDWENVEIGDITNNISIESDPDYWERFADINITSSDNSIIKVNTKQDNNVFNFEVINKGGPVTLTAVATDLFGNIISITKTIDKIGTWHYATNIEVRGNHSIDSPVSGVFQADGANNDELYVKVDGDNGGLTFEILDDNVPLNITEITSSDPEYHCYKITSKVNDYITHGTSTLKFIAVDSEVSGSVTKDVNIIWGNEVTGININDNSLIYDINGENFPSININKINGTLSVRNSSYPATIQTIQCESFDNSIFKFDLNTLVINTNNQFEVYYSLYKPGNTEFNLHAVDGGYIAHGTVNIYGFLFNTDSISVYQRESIQLLPVYNLRSGDSIIYTCNDSDIIETTEDHIVVNGIVTGINPGNTIVTVHNNGTGEYVPINDTINVTVLEKVNPLASINYNQHTYEFELTGGNVDNVEGTVGLTMLGEEPSIKPDYSIDNVIFTSSDNSIINYKNHNISSDNIHHILTYSLLKPGTATITASNNIDTIRDTSTVIISGIKFNTKSYDMKINDTLDLNSVLSVYFESSKVLTFFTYNPDTGESVNTDIIDVVESSRSSEPIYTVQNGIVKARKEGSICIRVDDGTDTYYDYIMINITKILNPKCADIKILYNNTEITDTIIYDATDTKYVYFKQIDENGDDMPTSTPVSLELVQIGTALNIIAHDPSTTTLPAASITTENPLLHIDTAALMITSNDGNCTRVLNISYGNKLRRVSLYQTSVVIDLGNLPQDNTFIAIPTCTNNNFIPTARWNWTSSDSSILSVDYNGYAQADPNDNNRIKIYTEWQALSTGTTTVQFNIIDESGTITLTIDVQVIDTVTPVKKDMLNTNLINLTYSDDPKEYQLNISESNYLSCLWESEISRIATVDQNGLVEIVGIPLADDFEYYSGDIPISDVYMEFDVKVTVQTETAKYYDTCTIHIEGESYNEDSHCVPRVVLRNFLNELEIGDNFTFKAAVAPYYLGNNDDNDTIKWRQTSDRWLLAEGRIEPVFTFNPNNTCNINDEVYVTTVSQNAYNGIHEEFDFKENIVTPPVGLTYDFGELTSSGETYDGDLNNDVDYELGEEPDAPTEFISDYDNYVDDAKYDFYVNNPKNSYVNRSSTYLKQYSISIKRN